MLSDLGFRIELGEIEARLLEHPAVRAAVVVAREVAGAAWVEAERSQPDGVGEKRLVAYYTVGEDAESINVEQLRTHLSAVLPQHMVPAAYMRLPSLPLTPNGKLDRRALPVPEADALGMSGYEPPQGEIETALAGIWAELLGLDRVGRNDHFFNCGGHSLLAMKLVASMRQRGIMITPEAIFTRPVLKDMAAHIAAPRSALTDEAICVRKGGSEAPLFLAHDGTDSLQYLYTLTPHLAHGIPVYGLPPTPLDDMSCTSFEVLASRMVRMIREVQPEGPYRVAGWSTGGVIAYEIATQLLRAGQGVGFLGLFDAAYIAGLDDDVRISLEEATNTFDDKSFLLREIQLQPGLHGNSGQLGQALARIRMSMAPMSFAELVSACEEESLLPADLTRLPAAKIRQVLLRRHTYIHAQVRYRASAISIPLHLFPARRAHFETPLLGWQAVLPVQQIRASPLPGDHYSIMVTPNIMVLAEQLGHALRGR